MAYAVTKQHTLSAPGHLPLLMPKESGIVGIAIKGLQGRYRLVNRAMESMFERRAGQIVGLTDADLFPPEVAAQLRSSDRQIIDSAAANSDELDFSINGKPMHCLWLRFPVLGLDGSVVSIGVVTIDVPRQEAVAELRESLERLQHANQQLQESMVQLNRLAGTDKLTGAWNRRRLEDAAIHEMDRLRRSDDPPSLLMIAIDLFKAVNDSHGHIVGDEVLVHLADVVRSSLRPTDSLTRWGGEEFVVLCPSTTRSTAAALAERLCESIAESRVAAVENLTISIGVAECVSGETWDQWLKRADDALYQAKTGGGNRVQVAAGTALRSADGEQVAANFVQLVWHPAYECGHPLIDDQHRSLIADANALLTAILSQRPSDEVGAMTDRLLHDVARHFEDEEALIATAGFPGAAQHATLHRQLIRRAEKLAKRFHDGALRLGELFQFLADDVVARHMLGADREFFPYLKARR